MLLKIPWEQQTPAMWASWKMTELEMVPSAPHQPPELFGEPSLPPFCWYSMIQCRHLYFPFSSRSFPSFRLTIPQFAWGKEGINIQNLFFFIQTWFISFSFELLSSSLSFCQSIQTCSSSTPFVCTTWHQPSRISIFEDTVNLGFSKGKEWVRSQKNRRCLFIPKLLLSDWKLTFITGLTVLSTSYRYPGFSNSCEFNFALWHNIYKSPSNSHEATQGHLSLTVTLLAVWWRKA